VEICAVGPATARALEERGARADLVPEEYVAESLVAAMQRGRGLGGQRVLFPRAERVRAVVPEALRAAGAEVHEVVVYRTLPDGSGAAAMRERLAAGEIDLITFTSGSTVRNFVELIGTELGRTRVACIGPVTAGVAAELGLPVHVTAAEYTAAGLVAAIVDESLRGSR
jgi:uroporphyrinogen III methyltransferase / synthase